MPMLPSFPPVHFDFGAIAALPAALSGRGVNRPLIITDEGLTRHGIVERVLAAFPDRHDVAVFDGIPPNPTIAGIDAALGVYVARGCDGIVALGAARCSIPARRCGSPRPIPARLSII
jgi:4-hydroxybutyrate dehydrogenase